MVEKPARQSEKERKWERERDRERGMKRDSKQVFSCAMHNEERQTAHKRPTNEAQVIYIHILSRYT